MATMDNHLQAEHSQAEQEGSAQAAPIIGITTYGRNEQDQYYLTGTYIDAVRAAGGIPVMLPPGEARVAEVLAWVDGVIFAGGGDIDPAHYGGVQHPTILPNDIDAERDAFELALARQVLADSTPTLGICRGAQVLTVASGGQLIEDIPDEQQSHAAEVREDAIVHRTDPEWTAHPVSVEGGSLLESILEDVPGEGLSVPSWHHQAAREVPSGWQVAARATDGIIEAMEHPAHPYMLAIQWHPERAIDQPQHLRLFTALVEAARQRRAARQAFYATPTPVESTNLANVRYNAACQVLEVQFQSSGAVYRYYEVPTELHQQLMAAESHGRFFNKHIRAGGFAYRRVE